MPVSIRERGDRNPARPSGAHQRPQRRQAPTARTTSARDAVEQRARGIAELLAAGDRLGDVRLSGGALTVLFELLGRATAALGPNLAGASAALDDDDITLWLEPHAAGMVLRSPLGDLALDGFRLAVGRAAHGRRCPADVITDEEAINE